MCGYRAASLQIYKGPLDAAGKLFRQHGPLKFWCGFWPLWGRAAPHSTLQLVIFDQLTTMAGFQSV